MPYHPPTNATTPAPYAEVRTRTPRQPRRAPNDFLDYNHGLDSYKPRQQPEGPVWSVVTPDRKPDQR